MEKEVIKKLLSLAEQREAFWQSIEDKAETFPTLFLEGYYEIIKELANLILILDGWKVSDHDCLFILK